MVPASSCCCGIDIGGGGVCDGGRGGSDSGKSGGSDDDNVGGSNISDGCSADGGTGLAVSRSVGCKFGDGVVPLNGVVKALPPA